MTLSPADMDSVLLMRLTNLRQEKDEFGIPITLPSSFNRLKHLAKNSVAAATVYQRMIETFFEELVGLKPSHMSRISPSPLHRRGEGALGLALAYASVTEIQSHPFLDCY